MSDNLANLLRQHQYRGGSKPKVLCEITYDKLAILFNVSVHTIKKWTYTQRLDPTNLEDIIDKYNNRYKIDKRRRYASHGPTHLPQGDLIRERNLENQGCASQ